MQRNWLVAFILAMVSSTTAFAADMPVKARPLPPPVFTWTGCYLGVHAGAGTLFDVGAVQIAQLADRHGIGALGGGQAGCNYQTGMLVLGIEAEGFASGIGNSIDVFNGGTRLVGTGHIKNTWDADVAARFGVAFDRILVYGKAGWAWGHFDWDSQTVGGQLQNASATLDGLLIGLGVEYAFAANWTTKFEYDYIGFRGKDVAFTTNFIPAVYDRTVSFEKHLFKIGLNYKFGDPSPASAVLSARNAMAAMPGAVAPFSWTGCYIGAQAGAGVMFAAGADDGANGPHGVGALAGGQLGCNYQTGMLVLGVEGDGLWSGMSSTHTFFNPTAPFSSYKDKNLWDFDIAARFGVAFDRVLVYGKAGWAWGRFTSDYQNINGTTASAAKTLDGLLMGMGVEYAFLPNWTTKFEYDYIGFNAKGVQVVRGDGFSFYESVSAAKHLFKVGVNYKFGGSDGAWGSARNAMAAYMPVKAAPAPFSWTGCYVGAQVGGGVIFDAGFTALQDNDRHGTGALAGGQAGCNYQTGMLVLGIEGEGFWSNIHNTIQAFQNNGTVTGTAHVNNNWDLDIAGRFGVAVERALVYGKAGWAVGRFTWDSSDVFGDTSSAAATLDGLLVGLGIEYAFLGNWTTKFEYDYIGFRAKDVQFTSNFGGGPFIQTQNVSADKHLVKFGLNYKFGPVLP